MIGLTPANAKIKTRRDAVWLTETLWVEWSKDLGDWRAWLDAKPQNDADLPIFRVATGPISAWARMVQSAGRPDRNRMLGIRVLVSVKSAPDEAQEKAREEAQDDRAEESTVVLRPLLAVSTEGSRKREVVTGGFSNLVLKDGGWAEVTGLFVCPPIGEKQTYDLMLDLPANSVVALAGMDLCWGDVTVEAETSKRLQTDGPQILRPFSARPIGHEDVLQRLGRPMLFSGAARVVGNRVEGHALAMPFDTPLRFSTDRQNRDVPADIPHNIALGISAPCGFSQSMADLPGQRGDPLTASLKDNESAVLARLTHSGAARTDDFESPQSHTIPFEDGPRRCLLLGAQHMPHKAARTGVVILNYNCPEDTLRLIASLEQSSDQDFDIFVVDNCSPNYSIKDLAALFTGYPLLCLPENLGYGAGNNAALHLIGDLDHEFIWILNPDVTVAPTALEDHVAGARAHPDAAFFGPVLCRGHDSDRIASAGSFVSFEGGLSTGHLYGGKKLSVLPKEPYRADFITGAAIFFRAEVLEKVGLLPEDYFLYFEETQWLLKAAERGQYCLVLPHIRVVHYKRSESNGLPSQYYFYYYLRNALIFCARMGIDDFHDTISKLRDNFIRTWLAKIDSIRPDLHAVYEYIAERALSDGQAGRTGRVAPSASDLQTVQTDIPGGHFSLQPTSEAGPNLMSDLITPSSRKQSAPLETAFQSMDIVAQIEARSLFWRPRYLRASAQLEHIPFLFWLCGALRPTCVVQLGQTDSVGYFALCQAVDKLTLEARCYNVTADPPEAAALAHNAEHYTDFSRFLHEPPLKAVQRFPEGSVDLLALDIAGTGGDIETSVLDDHWTSRLSERGIVLVHGSDAQFDSDAGQDFLKTLIGDRPSFRLDVGAGLLVVLWGQAPEDRIARLAELKLGQRGYSDVHQVFSRLGGLTRSEWGNHTAGPERDRLQADLKAAAEAARRDETRIAELEAVVARQSAKTAAQDTALAALQETAERVSEVEAKLAERDATLAQREAALRDAEAAMTQDRGEIQELHEKLRRLETSRNEEIVVMTATMEQADELRIQQHEQIKLQSVELARAEQATAEQTARANALEAERAAAEQEASALRQKLATAERSLNQHSESAARLALEATETAAALSKTEAALRAQIALTEAAEETRKRQRTEMAETHARDLKTLTAALEASKEEITRLTETLTQRTQEVKAVQARLEHTESHFMESERQRAEILESTSWKLTKPARKIANLAKGGAP